MSRLRSYAQLVRLPNVFTALADILLGALATGALPGRWLTFVLLGLASVGLYWGGMVFNDVFDVEQDKRERPHRPIPSGRVGRREAALLGGGLLLFGVVFAALSGATHEGDYRRAPLTLALLLVAAIFAYDGWLKPTPLGPIAMGACRSLNVLLGLTVVGEAKGGVGLHLALVVGLYIVGVTWFARTEARASRPTALSGAALVMFAALVVALPLPAQAKTSANPFLFPYLLVALGFLVGLPVARAVRTPTPSEVQTAVKRALLGLVVLDAVLATAFVGFWGLSVLLLVVPIRLLGRWRWLYAT